MLSFCTQDDRSKKRNSSAFSWSVNIEVSQPVGTPIDFSVVDCESETWMSL